MLASSSTAEQSQTALSLLALRESTDKDRTAAVADALVEEIHLVAQHGK